MKINYVLLILIGIIGIFYYNTFGWLVESWVHNEYYSHGFIILIVSTYIIWNMRKELGTIEKKQSNTGLIFIVGGISLQIFSNQWTIRSLSGISLLLTIGGIIVYIYGWEVMKKIKFPFLLLLLAIPMPFIDSIAAPAQTISVISSAEIARTIGLPVQRNGLVLDLPKVSFEVGLECSGINSIISLLTIGIIFAYMLEGSISMKTTITMSTIPLALTGNIIRIVSILVVGNKYGKDVAMNYYHDFSSLLLFSIALIGLFLVGRGFGRLKFKNIL